MGELKQQLQSAGLKVDEVTITSMTAQVSDPKSGSSAHQNSQQNPEQNPQAFQRQPQQHQGGQMLKDSNALQNSDEQNDFSEFMDGSEIMIHGRSAA